MYVFILKRVLDVIFSIVLAILLLPLLVIVLVLILLDDFGPVIFVQKRISKNKKIFNLLKFRSMKMSTPHDIPTHLLKDPDSYITRIGRFIRKTSIDEIPQLFNILIGDMSFVGPRPALWNQDDLIAERDKYNANDILPGLTGWAQVNGRDELPISVKAKFDGEYANNITFLFDLKCIILTIVVVFSRKGLKEGAN